MRSDGKALVFFFLLAAGDAFDVKVYGYGCKKEGKTVGLECTYGSYPVGSFSNFPCYIL